MDISAVNINFNAVNRTAFSSSSDEPEGPVQSTARFNQGQTGVSTESQLSQIPPATKPEPLAQEQSRTELQDHLPRRKVNITV